MERPDKPYLEVGVGSAKGADTAKAATEAATASKGKLEKHSPAAVIVFFSPKYDPYVVARSVQHVFPKTPVIGTTTAGEIFDSPLRESIVVLVFGSPYLKIRVGVGQGVSRNWKGSLERLLCGELSPYFDPLEISLWSRLNREGTGVFGILFSPGNTKKADSRSWEILSELRQRCDGRVLIFGGSSADDWQMEKSHVIVGDQAFPDSVALAVFETKLKFGMALAHGFKPSDKMATVTRSQNHVVHELDHRPAAEVYSQLLDIPYNELVGKHITLTSGRPAGLADPLGQYSIIVASYFTTDGGVRFSQPVPKGAILHIMDADPDALIHAAQDSLRKAIIRGDMSSPSLALMFSCALRGRILKERVHEEIAVIKEVAPDLPVVGFYSFGEQGLDDSKVNRHNNEVITTLVLADELRDSALTAFEHIGLQGKLERVVSILNVLRFVNQKLLAEKDKESMASFICEKLLDIKGYEGAMILFLDPQGSPLHLIAAGLGDEFLEVEKAIKQGRTLTCIDTALSTPVVSVLETSKMCPDCPLSGHELCINALCVGIRYEGRCYGTLTVCCSKIELLDEEKELVSEFAGDFAFAIRKMQLEEELAKSEEIFRKAFEASPDWVTISTLADGRYVDVNEAYCRATGRKKEEVIGKTSLELGLWADPEDRVRASRILEETGRLRDFEVVFKKKGGEEILALWSAEVVEINGVKHIISVVNDITEKRRLEAQLIHSQKMEAIGTLAGGIAHDFNNLLQAILGYTQILKMERSESDPGYSEISAIEKTALRARDLTARILAFSRDIEPELKPIDLNRQIKESQKILERTLPKSIQLEFHLDPNLKLINADSSQLEQIILNLAINARDAMPQGGRLSFETANVTLDHKYCRINPGVVPGEYVLLSVSDTGHGMDQDTLQKIFDPFFTTKEPGKGTGLGLATVYGIVKNHHGHINCYSKEGIGTTFKIYFPVISFTQDEAPPLIREQDIPKGKGELVLFVDDEDALRELGKQILTRFGYRVVTAENGREALEIFKEKQQEIALVILDLIMPEMEGDHCLKEILKISPGAKVLIASGYSPNGPFKEMLTIGAKGFIAKPYEIKEMLQTIRDVIEQ